MEQIICVIAGGSLFLSVVADLEVREAIQSSGRRISPRQARIQGLGAGAVVMAMGTLICLLLAANG